MTQLQLRQHRIVDGQQGVVVELYRQQQAHRAERFIGHERNPIAAEVEEFKVGEVGEEFAFDESNCVVTDVENLHEKVTIFE